jgi:hypothetical protein
MTKNIYSLLLVVLCAGILSVAMPNAHAAEYREEAIALIDRKGPNALTFDGHGFKGFVDRYMQVSALTHFYDENGEEISFANLKVPCQARILYRKKSSGGVPEAISVHVEHYREDRPIDTQWTLPRMKPEQPQ